MPTTRAKPPVRSQSMDAGGGYNDDYNGEYTRPRIQNIDPNFRSIVVYVYRNGDEFDQGAEISVTKREFANWLSFLDYLTKRCKMNNSVNSIFTLDGQPIRGFADLDDGGEYVVASKKFKKVNYASKKAFQDFVVEPKIKYRDPGSVTSKKSLLIAAKKAGIPTNDISTRRVPRRPAYDDGYDNYGGSLPELNSRGRGVVARDNRYDDRQYDRGRPDNNYGGGGSRQPPPQPPVNRQAPPPANNTRYDDGIDYGEPPPPAQPPPPVPDPKASEPPPPPQPPTDKPPEPVKERPPSGDSLSSFAKFKIRKAKPAAPPAQ